MCHRRAFYVLATRQRCRTDGTQAPFSAVRCGRVGGLRAPIFIRARRDAIECGAGPAMAKSAIAGPAHLGVQHGVNFQLSARSRAVIQLQRSTDWRGVLVCGGPGYVTLHWRVLCRCNTGRGSKGGRAAICAYALLRRYALHLVLSTIVNFRPPLWFFFSFFSSNTTDTGRLKPATSAGHIRESPGGNNINVVNRP